MYLKATSGANHTHQGSDDRVVVDLLGNIH